MLPALKRAMREYLIRRLDVPTIPSALERLCTLGYKPNRIFDVGAHVGDFARLCRSVWPASSISCFEVLPHRVRQLRAWAAQDGRTEVFDCLLGARSRDAVPFHEMETASSVLDEHVHQVDPVNSYPMRTIDEVGQPDFLKMDVQGYELEILKGAERSLSGVSAILTEIHLIDIHMGVALFDEMVVFLRSRDFVAYDICGFYRRPLDRALWVADMVFVPINSPLRFDKRWTA